MVFLMKSKSSTKGHANDLDILVGENLRKIRKRMGYSQERLASLVGITFQQVQKQENGKNRISSVRLLEYSIILKTNIYEFFEGVENIAMQRIQERMNAVI